MFKQLLKKQRILKRLESKYNIQEEYDRIYRKESLCSKYERDLIVSLFEMELNPQLLEAFEQRKLKTDENIHQETS